MIFYFREPVVETRKQVYIYGFVNFVAEVGGYMGLLLGMSLLSIYEWIANGIRNAGNL